MIFRQMVLFNIIRLYLMAVQEAAEAVLVEEAAEAAEAPKKLPINANLKL
jgi:hypothetical protein